MKILITPRGFATYGLEHIEFMKSKGFEVQYNATGKAYTHDEFMAYAKDADAIIVGVDNMDKETLAACTKLKVICKFGVGTDNIDVTYTKEHGIYVGRCVGSNSKSVAEHVMAMMFTEAKHMVRSVNEVKAHKWNKLTGREISGKTLGIVGFGMIGKYLAKFAYGVGMQVYAYDAFEIPLEDIETYHIQVKSLDEIITTCDYVSLHVPLLDSTKHMISTNEFKKMKNTACLLNAARGGIVDEEALYEALVRGDIRSACFDVYSSEPPMEDDKLIKLDNFMLTPHTAARSMESEMRTVQMSTNIIMEQLLG